MAKKIKPEELQLREIREIMLRHDGSLTQIANGLTPPVRVPAVSSVLAGRMASKRILDACREKALALLEQERKQQAKGAA